MTSLRQAHVYCPLGRDKLLNRDVLGEHQQVLVAHEVEEVVIRLGLDLERHGARVVDGHDPGRRAAERRDDHYDAADLVEFVVLGTNLSTIRKLRSDVTKSRHMGMSTQSVLTMITCSTPLAIFR